MEIAGTTPLGWIVIFVFAAICGTAVFYLLYGAARLFEGESAPDDGSTWLLNRRTPIVIVLSVISLIVIALVAAGV